MTVWVDRSLKGDFDVFFHEVTADGALPFTMPDPTTDTWPLLNHNGVPLLDQLSRPLLMSKIWVCFFGETTPVVTPIGMQFKITFPIVVLP